MTTSEAKKQYYQLNGFTESWMEYVLRLAREDEKYDAS